MATIITPSEVPKFVPGAVTVASDDLGWNGVWLRGYRYTGLDVIVPPVRDFTIVSYLRGATFMERRCEGPWAQTHCTRRCFAVDQVAAFALALDRGN
jgi:AraC family transcriptional regulator